MLPTANNNRVKVEGAASILAVQTEADFKGAAEQDPQRNGFPVRPGILAQVFPGNALVFDPAMGHASWSSRDVDKKPSVSNGSEKSSQD